MGVHLLLTIKQKIMAQELASKYQAKYGYIDMGVHLLVNIKPSFETPKLFNLFPWFNVFECGEILYLTSI